MAKTQSDDPRNSWHPARLIPTTGLKGEAEQERRATSVLLAVMVAVPEFTSSLLRYCGAPKGRVSTYTEVQLKDPDGTLHIPDGVIVVERGKTVWRALVEVKTGSGELTTEQISRYMEMARQHGFDMVLTMSNRITDSPEDLPFAVDKRKLRSTSVRHLSWWTIITEAIMQYRHRGVSDPDQAWILGELIAYLDHPASGASGFDDMGDQWTRVRDDAKHETLRPTDPPVRVVAERWLQYLDFVALGMAQELGRDVVAVRARQATAADRVDAATRELGSEGRLTGTIKIPDASAAIELETNLRTRRVITSCEIDAPREGRPQTRVTWLIKQLKDAPGDLRIDVRFQGSRETQSLLLEEAREQPERLLCASNVKRDPRSFTVALGRKMGQKRGKGPGSFVAETREQTIDFYREVVQNLRRWTAKAPKMPDAEPKVTPPAESQQFIGTSFEGSGAREDVPEPVSSHSD